MDQRWVALIDCDATWLHIPAHRTVHIEYPGQQDDWPHYLVTIQQQQVLVRAPDRHPLVHYRYGYAVPAGDGWLFISPDEDFFICAGPALAPSMDTAAPQTNP